MSTTRALISNGGIVTKKADSALIRFRLVCEGSDADHVKYISAVTDRPIGITIDGANAAEDPVAIQLLGRGETKIVKLNGTCSKGDHLTPENPGTDAGGKARAVPATAGSYWAFGRALETGVDEQEIAVEDYMPILKGPQHEGRLCLPGFAGDPTTPIESDFWYDYTNHRVRAALASGTAVTIANVLLALMFCLFALQVQVFGGDKTPVVVSNATTGTFAAATGSDNVKIPGTLEVTGASTIAGLQTEDATLTALAGLSTGANKIPYFTNTDAASVVTSSANIISLLGSADYATARTNLGLAISTNVQAYDADLTTYAGITPAANVQSLLGCADYSAMRTALTLVPGTNVQAYDADLTTYAGITPAANVQSLLGCADYSAMRTALSLAPGTNVQAYDADLTTYAGITPSANIQSLLGCADYSAARTAQGLAIGTNVQAYDADLDDLADGLLTYSKVGLPAVRTMSQAVTVSEFTDDLGTSGHLDLGTQIPAQSIVLGWKANVTAGFTGDTKAEIMLGIAGDTDAFSAFTANDGFGITKFGSNALAAASYASAASTVRVTITGGADFTSIKTAAAGAATITVYYVQTE